MNKLKVGVVGVGHIGKEHARIYARHPDIEFTAIYDANQEVARRIGAQYHVPAFSSLPEFMARIDAASLATPSNTHYRLGEELLQHGKHLLIEKPITDNVEEARKLVALAAAKNLVLQVGHIERFNPAFTALEGLLTHPRFIEAHRLSPYPGRSTDIGVVLDLMIHDLEIILHLVRSPLASLDAVGVSVLSTSEDIANARLRFANGCVANITTSRISPEKLRKIRVFQDDTYLSLDYQDQSGEIYRKVDGKITRDRIPVQKDEPLKLELHSFVTCVLARQSPVVGGAQAAEALAIAMEITNQIAAAGSGHPV